MIKFVISPERFAEACSLTEYVGILVGNIGSQMQALPKFLVDDKDKYVVEIVLDSEGDIAEVKNLAKANARMINISVPRFERLRKELTEAAKNIVNPQSGGDLNKQ